MKKLILSFLVLVCLFMSHMKAQDFTHYTSEYGGWCGVNHIFFDNNGNIWFTKAG